MDYFIFLLALSSCNSGARGSGANYRTTGNTNTSFLVSEGERDRVKIETYLILIFTHTHSLIALPPLLLPIYFHVDVVIYLILKRKWQVRE